MILIFFWVFDKTMQVKINKVKQNLKQSKGCACEKHPSQKCSFSSPAMAPEKVLDACGGVIFLPSSWEPQEEGMMSIAPRFFPQLRNQGLLFRRGADKRLKVMLASLRQLRTIYRAPHLSFALLAATRNLHTTQPNTLFLTYDEVVNLSGLLETKGMSVSSGK
jgi:hypothetical protein